MVLSPEMWGLDNEEEEGRERVGDAMETWLLWF